MGFIINIIQYTKMIELHDPEKVSSLVKITIYLKSKRQLKIVTN